MDLSQTGVFFLGLLCFLFQLIFWTLGLKENFQKNYAQIFIYFLSCFDRFGSRLF
jgi:hypothetical protein